MRDWRFLVLLWRVLWLAIRCRGFLWQFNLHKAITCTICNIQLHLRTVKIPRIGCDERSVGAHLSDPCTGVSLWRLPNQRRWDGKPDQTPLTRHDMNFWLFSGEPTTTWKTFLFVSSHHFEPKEFSCAEVALRVSKSWLRRRTRASHRWLRCLWRRPMSSLCFCSVPQPTAYLLNSQNSTSPA